MTTAAMETAQPVVARHRATGSIIGTVSLVLGPALGAIGVLFRHEIWPETYPDFAAVEKFHTQNVVATQVTSVGFVLLIFSVIAIAQASRGSRRLISVAMVATVVGLIALFGKDVQNASAVAMAGLPDHETLNALAKNITDQSPFVLWAFPLYIVGSVLQGVALWRTPGVPHWAAVAVGAGALAPVSVITGVGLIGVIIAGIRIAGSWPLIAILRTREDD